MRKRTFPTQEKKEAKQGSAKADSPLTRTRQATTTERAEKGLETATSRPSQKTTERQASAAFRALGSSQTSSPSKAAAPTIASAFTSRFQAPSPAASIFLALASQKSQAGKKESNITRAKPS